MRSTIWSDLVLAAMENGRWKPGIGDPTPMGWVTTLAYLLAALLCAWSAVKCLDTHSDAQHRKMHASFWLSVACALFFLCMNKQLDLQSLLTQVGRDWAKSGGWYEQRHTFQTYFIWTLAISGFISLFALSWAVWKAHRRYHFALIGLVFILCFVLIRAASFHHVDHFLGLQIAGLKMNWVLELGGIFVVGASALVHENSDE